MDTYITLIALSIGAMWFVNWLIHQMFEHDGNEDASTLNKPLKNKGKWWH